MGILSFFKRLFIKKKPKIGLALGSGGAKGAAHLGVLKAFEEENITFDMAAGTSAGSIIGALLSLGYSVGEMLSILSAYKISERISVIKLTLSKDSLITTLDKIFSDATFGDTKIPFRAVACDLISGEEVVLSQGKLCYALAASSAVPPAFRPVEIDGKRYVDGAFCNAVPSDVVKSLGADIVISVALHNQPSNKNLKRYLDIMYKGHGVKSRNRLEGLKDSDYTLYLPLDDFNSSDVKNMDQMFKIGYETAKNHMAEIKSVIARFKKGKKRR